MNWISIKVKLPENLQNVIATDGEFFYGCCSYEDDNFTVDGYDPCDRVELEGITHWANIPSLNEKVLLIN